MDTLVKLNSQTAGRDKIARLLQYLSRVLWNRLQSSNKDTAAGIKNLEYQLSTFRKLLRFGRCIDTLYSTLPVFHHHDQTIRITVILSKICNALFLLADHILWLGRSDLCSVQTERWTKMSNKYWLFSITMNLVRDFYEISQILKDEKRTILPRRIKSTADYVQIGQNVMLCLLRNKHILADTIKNGCDFFIPMTALGHFKLSPGTIGLLGVVSSIAGMLVLIDPKFKLTP